MHIAMLRCTRPRQTAAICVLIRVGGSQTARTRPVLPAGNDTHCARSADHFSNETLRFPGESRLGARFDLAHGVDELVDDEGVENVLEGARVADVEWVGSLGNALRWAEEGTFYTRCRELRVHVLLLVCVGWCVLMLARA